VIGLVARSWARLVDGVVDRVVDRGVLGDRLLRLAIRGLLWRRRRAITSGDVEARSARRRELLASLEVAPVAVATDEANAQHYEVPTELFERMLGPHLKYSCAWYPPDERGRTAAGASDLGDAEAAMLALTCERAELADGQDVLELGCGWGSLSLWMAEHYPSSRITVVSNSATQRAHIEARAKERGLTNLRILTCDVNRLGVDAYADVVSADTFDRVVSVEMFEHVRNHGQLTSRISSWLRPGGKLFVHVFCHATDPYPFETGSRGDWMARHFFTGGIMPSADLLLHSVERLAIEDQWAVSGRHYARTLGAWLARLDADREGIVAVLARTYGADAAMMWWRRWRTFTIACQELFAARDGDEWYVSHYRFTRPEASARR
jgi:cyclopropane-fatty-acyl-phospholipid synthase